PHRLGGGALRSSWLFVVAVTRSGRLRTSADRLRPPPSTEDQAWWPAEYRRTKHKAAEALVLLLDPVLERLTGKTLDNAAEVVGRKAGPVSTTSLGREENRLVP
ncbi:hypothetical protein, partial [Streptomyces sp. AA1529]